MFHLNIQHIISRAVQRSDCKYQLANLNQPWQLLITHSFLFLARIISHRLSWTISSGQLTLFESPDSQKMFVENTFIFLILIISVDGNIFKSNKYKCTLRVKCDANRNYDVVQSAILLQILCSCRSTVAIASITCSMTIWRLNAMFFSG